VAFKNHNVINPLPAGDAISLYNLEEELKLQESTKVMKSKIALFNKKHPVGASVVVVKDAGEKIETKVRYPAEIMGGHTAVVWLNGISGAYALNRVVA
jgi:hypothetical protein